MKRSLLLVSLVVILALLAAPLSVLAQDGGKKTADFTSKDEKLTASYPEDWFAAENVDFPGFTIANSEELLASIMDSSTPSTVQSGEAAFQVILLPEAAMGMMGMEITEEMTLADVVKLFAEGITASDDPESKTTVGEAEVIEIGEGDQKMEVGKATLTNETDKSEGYLAIFMPAEGVYAIAAAQTYTGEMTDELDAIFMDILSTIEYTGTGDDLLNSLMGAGNETGAAEEATPEATPEITATPAK